MKNLYIKKKKDLIFKIGLQTINTKTQNNYAKA